ncbi:paraneoplastic antigen Ma1 homolog [Chanos chanos]|uniref:Paraneoplastic antigen Ma1 homolog n=1 Tax=Chanos chanos TaxID=29144 RepID=A0A6J2V544_CHACN|nr:paraneoplastic antigen Ma1 homolog [Chanos chanos]
MAQLPYWCKGEGIDPEHAILVKDVPVDTELHFIESTLESIKALTMLEKVNGKSIPLDVLPEGAEEPWRIVGPLAEEHQMPAQDGRRGDHVADAASPLQACSPEAIIRAEQLVNWVEQARFMVEECDRSDREKGMRILVSLKGPALEIIQAVRFNNPEATPREYADVIENTFGTLETEEELYFTFRLLSQHPGERLSEFLRRMERVLSKVVQKGGLPPTLADRARLGQLIKGATGSDMMVLNLGICLSTKQEEETMVERVYIYC